MIGDRYAGEFPRELFRKHGIAYDLAKQTKSELFRDLLPLLNSGRIVLPHNDRLLRLGVAPARLAGTPSRIPTAATMTWQMPSPARQRSQIRRIRHQHALGVSGDDDSGDAWQRVSLQAFVNSGGRIRL